MLRRKRVSLGCSVGEQQAAESIAQAIIARYMLKYAEVLDRQYLKEQEAAKQPTQAPARKRGYDDNWRRATGNGAWFRRNINIEVDECDLA